jgi:hypothetical protein
LNYAELEIDELNGLIEAFVVEMKPGDIFVMVLNGDLGAHQTLGRFGMQVSTSPPLDLVRPFRSGLQSKSIAPLRAQQKL